MCLIVCSLFFQKISYRYTHIHFIIDAPRVLQNFTPSYHRPCPRFDHFLKSTKIIQKKSKKCKTFALHPNLCPSNRTKEQTWNTTNILKKSFQNELSSLKIHDFQAK